jgi:hypothetical protein
MPLPLVRMAAAIVGEGAVLVAKPTEVAMRPGRSPSAAAARTDQSRCRGAPISHGISLFSLSSPTLGSNSGIALPRRQCAMG